MFELFKLVGRVMVDASGANQALSDTDRKAQGTTSNLGGYMDKLKAWAAAAGAAIAGSAIVKGLKEVWDMSSQVAEIGDNIDKSSQKFMLSRQAYQEWSYVAQRSGFDINQLGSAVVDLSKKVGEGKEDTLAVLEELGISAAEAMTATPEELFDMVVEGLQGVGESTRRAYLADKAFGGAAKDLNPLLNQSTEETKALKDEVHKLGGVMSDDLVKKSADYSDAVTSLSTAWQGLKNSLGDEFLPSMTTILTGIKDVLTGDVAGGLQLTAEGVEQFLGSILIGFGRFLVDIVKSAVNGIAELAKGAYEFGRDFFNPETDNTEEMDKFLNDGKPFEENSDSLIDDLLALRNEYLSYGGSEFAFISEVTDKYGAEVADQLIAALEQSGDEIDGATEDYADAVDGASKAWADAELKINDASDRAAKAMDEAAQRLQCDPNGPKNNHSDYLPGHYSGLEFVPRDNYVARLHYGERVLTRQEAEEYNAGKTNGGNTTINIQTVAQSPAQTAAAITAALARARWAM